MTNSIKYNLYDSFFTHLFNQPKYALQLYQSLHSEDTDTTIDDIKIETLNNVFSNQIYNDFGMLVKDRLLIFVEAQSTWNPNIIYRCKYYANNTELRYIEERGINLFSSYHIRIPRCEFYCVFTGKQNNHPDVLRLSDEYFNGESIDNDITVHMIYSKENCSDIIHQYIDLCRIIIEQITMYGKSPKAIEESIKICQNKGILKEYLEELTPEVITMEFYDIFDQERITRLTQKENEEHEKAAIEKAVKEATEEATVNTILSLYHDGLITKDVVCQKLEISEEECTRLLNQ